jgi:RNA 3'-terminal phosphate cyclase
LEQREVGARVVLEHAVGDVVEAEHVSASVSGTPIRVTAIRIRNAPEGLEIPL